MLHKYKYDGDTGKYVLIQRRMPLLLTPAEMTWIAQLKPLRKYVVVIVYESGFHSILTEPGNPHFFAEAVEDFLSYICEMFGDLVTVHRLRHVMTMDLTNMK